MGEHAGAFVDAVQTAAMLVMASAQIYTMLLLRNEMAALATTLNRVLGAQTPLVQQQEELRHRLEEIEQGRQSGGSDVVRDWLGKAWQNIVKIEARLDALEKGDPPPPGTRPTDPPLP